MKTEIIESKSRRPQARQRKNRPVYAVMLYGAARYELISVHQTYANAQKKIEQLEAEAIADVGYCLAEFDIKTIDLED